MISLRNFSINDAEEFQKKYVNRSLDEIRIMFPKWAEKEHASKYFEMFAVMNDERIVGTISLYHHSDSVVSCGPEVFEEYRNQGIGKAAMLLAMDMAKIKGYKIVCQQIRVCNAASIALHDSLGFETNNYIYKNRRGNEVLIYLKLL